MKKIAGAVKVAISLPADLAAAAERQRKAWGQTRSEFFRTAAKTILDAERQRLAVAEYVAGYRQHPETEPDMRAFFRLALGTLAEERWD